MPGRRWSDGLHQAVEAKEGVRVKEENQTLATITLQNFFKLYDKISGMTGTAMTEAAEFWKVYKLDVIAIPTNRSIRRINYADVIYRTEREKYTAIADEIENINNWDWSDRLRARPGRTIVRETDEAIGRGQGIQKGHQTNTREKIKPIQQRGGPILAGTVFIQRSELISAMLEKAASRTRSSTPSIISARPRSWPRPAERCGHHRHQHGRAVRTSSSAAIPRPWPGPSSRKNIPRGWKSRRTNGTRWSTKSSSANKSRPKAAKSREWAVRTSSAANVTRHAVSTSSCAAVRAGKAIQVPAVSSLAGRRPDAVFAGEWVKNILTRLGMKEGEAIENAMVTRASRGPEKGRRRKFEIRKNLLKYDEVMNEQPQAGLWLPPEHSQRGELQNQVNRRDDGRADQYASPR